MESGVWGYCTWMAAAFWQLLAPGRSRKGQVGLGVVWAWDGYCVWDRRGFLDRFGVPIRLDRRWDVMRMQAFDGKDHL
jgi:hypothetical protein